MMKEETHIFQGMKRDVHQIRQDGKFLWDAHNIRITSREDSTGFSITNEKGTLDTGISFLGYYVGHCVLGKYLVVFTAGTDGSNNYIYRVEKTEEGYDLVILFHEESAWSGSWNPDNPIEAIGVYETELIQKVYWVDGINQPRVINITKPELDPTLEFPYYSKEDFNFTPALSLNEKVKVVKSYGNGEFSSGVIQYAMSYYCKYGQESNIFYTTPLQYISPKERGGSPEETVGNNFYIEISNLDSKFDYIRLYSIHRTSIDSVPTVKVVTDLPIDNLDKVSYLDNNTSGYTIDPTQLLYIGGESIIAESIAHKDNTLFLGNLELLNAKNISNSVTNSGYKWIKDVSPNIYPEYAYSTYYHYNPELNTNRPGFTTGETYRVGIQVQYDDGKWSSPVFIEDKVLVENYPWAEYRRNNKLVILRSLSTRLIAAGARRIRPCIVFPTIQDREVICQGVLCPTVYWADARKKNSYYAMSSWFFRSATKSISSTGNLAQGSCIQFEHNKSLFAGPNSGAEIQNMIAPKDSASIDLSSLQDSLPSQYKPSFFVDENIVTFHSPDLEFNQDLWNYPWEGTKLRIVGAAIMGASSGDIDIQISTPGLGKFIKQYVGFQTRNNINLNGGLVATGSYGASNGSTWTIYPWHKSGSIEGNEGSNEENNETPATGVLGRKKISNLKFFPKNIGLTPINSTGNSPILDYEISTPKLYSASESSIIKIKPAHLGKDITYLGNLDTLITSSIEYPIYHWGDSGPDAENSPGTSVEPVRMKYKSTPHLVFSLDDGYENIPILPRHIDVGSPIDKQAFKYPEWITWGSGDASNNDSGGYDFKVRYEVKDRDIDYSTATPSSDWENELLIQTTNGVTKIYICKYLGNGFGWTGLDYKNSGKVAVISSSTYIRDSFPTSTTGERVYIKLTFVGDDPINGSWTIEPIQYSPPTTTPSEFFITRKGFGVQNTLYTPYLLIGELYRDKSDTKFGGTTNSALISNLWVPAGDPVKLDAVNDVVLSFTWGDSWYSRYDCLKTYPFTQEDENSIVEIGSFMVETRINIDGRYDKNRGQYSNLNMTPQNFNLFNEVYSQKDNFFNYRILDEDYYKQSKFGNQITWSKEKHAGEEVDSWTNITLANTLDLDGSKGKVTAIIPWNELLLAFQEKGLNQLLFNSRVQIPVTDGVPIEISNGAKMDGSRLINGSIGCYNKWSICSTPMGVYFIDSNTASLYLFNGQLSNLSRNKGMDWWPKQATLDSVWKPGNAIAPTKNGIRTFYDAKYGDIYFTPGVQRSLQKDAICFSESLDNFVSQMSYGGVPAMFNFSDGFYSINKVGTSLGLHQNNAGKYNNFYGKYKSWDFSFISNDNSIYTKIFDTVDLRADHENKNLLNTCPVNFIEVSNEYQNAQATLDNKNMRKKFRVWRGIIPRNSGTRERIRNPWTKITLGYNSAIDEVKDNKAIVHDVTVHYTI